MVLRLDVGLMVVDVCVCGCCLDSTRYEQTWCVYTRNCHVHEWSAVINHGASCILNAMSEQCRLNVPLRTY